ncbi:MAG: DNA-processing protein DprA [Haliea sp.]|nr:DNA-processing protein DprA [Haliea sp.]
MDTETLRLCLLLHSLPRLQGRQLRHLLEYFTTPEALWQADPAALVAAGASSAAVQDLALAHRLGRHPQAPVDIEAQLDLLQAVNAQVRVLGQPGYPALLAAIPDPPPFLYVRGQPAALQLPQLAVVGSRKASAVGLRAATELAGGAARSGLAITSGLALGIDAAAHRGALLAQGASIAVMATGIEAVYPRRHQALADELLDTGCLVTEFAPLTPPLPGHFPARNRIISGLSLGVLVVEAALPSGSLITAGTALEQGREVFALPWFPGHLGGRGCLHLLRDGAVMVQGIEDILGELGSLFDAQQAFPRPPERALAGLEQAGKLTGSQHGLLAFIGYEEVGVEALVSASGRPLPEVLAALSALEMQGFVVRQGGGYLRSDSGLATFK